MMKAENYYLINSSRNLPPSLSYYRCDNDVSDFPIRFNSQPQDFMAHTSIPQTKVRRLDHLGIIAGVIKKLRIVEVIDEALGKDDREHISSGMAIAGMVLNGLGYTNRPLMLTPQFFENKAMSCLFKEGVKAEYFNKHKLGRTLDNVSEFGSSKLFSIVSTNACAIEKVDTKTAHLDTTSHSVSGQYNEEFDTYPIKLTYGHSKDNKPGNKQVVQELIVSEDGGIPLLSKVFDGNASDNTIFCERVKMVTKEFAKSTEKYLIADSKLLTKKSAPYLNKIHFITRIAGPGKAEENVILQALEMNDWNNIPDDENYKTKEFASKLYDIDGLRLIVVKSEHALSRAQKSTNRSAEREKEKIDKALFHLQAQRFMCKEDAIKELEKLTKKWKFHNVDTQEIISQKKYEKKGPPKKDDPYTLLFQIKAQASRDQPSLDLVINKKSCFVVTTNVPQEKLNEEEALKIYKSQDKVEKGFAFLKSPEFFTSSFYLKSPKRIEALVTMVMTLALLVYSIAQRTMRNKLAYLKATLPNQINKETATPTMRWIFQLLEGINYVTVIVNGITHTIIEGLTELRIKILRLFGNEVMELYKIL